MTSPLLPSLVWRGSASELQKPRNPSSSLSSSSSSPQSTTTTTVTATATTSTPDGRGHSVRRFVRRLLSNSDGGGGRRPPTAVAATPPPPVPPTICPNADGTVVFVAAAATAAAADATTVSEKAQLYAAKKQHSAVSVASSDDASDSAIASRKDDDSDEGCVVSCREDGVAQPGERRGGLELSMVQVDIMEPCSVAEKVQRWKDTMGRSKARSRRPPPERSQRSVDSVSSCRDSLDSGLHSLSLSSWSGPVNGVEPSAAGVSKPADDVHDDGTQETKLHQPSASHRSTSSPLRTMQEVARVDGPAATRVGDNALIRASGLSHSLASNGDVETNNERTSRPPASVNCYELDAGEAKDIFTVAQPSSLNRSDSLLTERRPSSSGESWCSSAGVCTGIDEYVDAADGELRPISLPIASQTRLTAHEAQEISRFMDMFVLKIFDDYSSLSLAEKSQLGVLARTPAGRAAFARSLDGRRAGRACLTEGAFLSLAQSTAVVLFESCEAGDWSPAKVLMNMCFTFYTEEIQNDGSVVREHLYNQLASQPIWKSLRFWNAAFFEAILCERAKFNLPSVATPASVDALPTTGHENCDGTATRASIRPDKESQRQCLENITFSQLAAFTHNMHAFGLPAHMCLQFLEKQLVIGNLPHVQEQLLRENVESLYRIQPKKD